jgi:hypothetical protein
MKKIFFLFAIFAALLFCTEGRADDSANLAIDAVRVSSSCKAPVHAMPSMDSAVVTRDTGLDFYVSGARECADGIWYEVIFPVKGWMHESVAQFHNASRSYDPVSISLGRRLVLRLKADYGVTLAMWHKSLGEPLMMDSWKSNAEYGRAEMQVATWESFALATENYMYERRQLDADIVKATACAGSTLSFGPFHLGDPGEKLSSFVDGFIAEPNATLTFEGFFFALDENARISHMAYSAQAGEFLSCPATRMLNDPNTPVLPAIYPLSWCPNRLLRQNIDATAVYRGRSGKNNRPIFQIGPASLAMEIGSPAISQHLVDSNRNTSFSVNYNLLQTWDVEDGACVYDPVLQNAHPLR